MMQRKAFGFTLAAMMVAASSFAAPTAVEHFNAYTSMTTAGASATSDVSGLTLNVAGTPASGGFVLDAASYSGNGISWAGPESAAVFYDDAWPGFTSSQVTLAFAAKYTAVAGASLRTQTVGHWSTQAYNDPSGIPPFMARFGTDATSASGLILTINTTGATAYGSTTAITEATPGSTFHTFVIQFNPATSTSTSDGGLNVWINETNPAAAADAALATGWGGFQGIDAYHSPALGAWIFSPVAGPTVSLDEVAVWQGNTATELADAMAYIASPAGVSDWTTLD